MAQPSTRKAMRSHHPTKRILTFSILFTMAEPHTTPSVKPAISATCSGVEIPNPATSGMST